MKKLKKYKISVIGPTIVGNQGAALMMESVLQEFYKDCEVINLFSYYPKKDREVNKNKKVKIYSARPADLMVRFFVTLVVVFLKNLGFEKRKLCKCFPDLKAIEESDVFLDLAGVSFMDGRLKFIPFNVLTIWPALVLQVPVVKMAQALGPFNNKTNRTVAEFVLPKIKKIFARGKTTRKHLRSIGLQNVGLSTDLSFILKSAGKKQKKRTRRKIVGMSLSTVVWSYCEKNGSDYIKIMAGFINFLNKKGYGVLLIPHSYILGSSKKRNNDLPLSKTVHGLVSDKEKTKVFSPTVYDSQYVRKVIAKTDLYVASRFHSMVSAIESGVPTMVCGWSHKYLEVLELFGLSKYAFSYKKLSLKKLIKCFEKLEKNQETERINIKNGLASARELSNKQFKFVRSLLEV